MKIAPFRAGDLALLDLQKAQASFSELIADPQYGVSIERAGQSYTVWVDGAPILCAGLIPLWQDRATAWALVSMHAGRHFFSIHRAVRGFLKQAPYRRIEATVQAGFPEAWRWIQLLGFEHEGLMRAYAPDGSDHHLFARVS